ncbi:DUF4333 domain-containing protein [Parasphingorhabdus pacifica]
MRSFVVVSLLVVGLAGCGTVTVGKGEVESQISAQLEQKVGQAPDSVTCPGDLPAEVGETMRCELSAGGEKLGISTEVTEVDGTDVRFDIQVDEK